ncbi:Protein C31H2.4 [Aphelenchoides avenae]|nr:Protein C31H2.4 [Aphelenchus avenae]
MTTADLISSFHHIEIVVSNALQASFWYCCNFAFERFAQRRTAESVEIAVRNGPVVIIFKCAYKPGVPEITDDLAEHGDFVKDVSFCVDDVEEIVNKVRAYGSKVLQEPTTVCNDDGKLLIAKIRGSAGSIVHTLIQNVDYKGLLLPGFKPLANIEFCERLGPIPFTGLDHVVENHPEQSLDSVTEWYERTLRMNRFWSIDDTVVHTQYSALKAMIVTNASREVQVTLAEPVPVTRRTRGQLQEFLDFNGGPGIQHIAFKVDDIVSAVEQVRQRAVEFLDIPDSYYDQLEERLATSKVKVTQDLKEIRRLKILIDFDENGYLLQIFTKPVQDRPTLFIEIIERHNFNGFGAGNFKALFDAVELEQKARGTLFTGSEETAAQSESGKIPNGIQS